MKYKKYDLSDAKDFKEFTSIKATLGDDRGYIYLISNSDGFEYGTLSVNWETPYDYFSRRKYLKEDGWDIVYLSEPHSQYKQNLEKMIEYFYYNKEIQMLVPDIAFIKTIERLTVDGEFIEPQDLQTKIKKSE